MAICCSTLSFTSQSVVVVGVVVVAAKGSSWLLVFMVGAVMHRAIGLTKRAQERGQWEATGNAVWRGPATAASSRPTMDGAVIVGSKGIWEEVRI